MNFFAKFLIFLFGGIMFAVFAQADVEIHIFRAETDTDSNYESVGIEDVSGLSGITKMYSTSTTVNETAYGFNQFTTTGGVSEYTPTYNWVALDNPTNLSLGDDEVSGFIDLGFNTSFYPRADWTTLYDKVKVSSNGFVTFEDMPHGCCWGQNMPDTTSPNSLIAGWWEDLRPASGGGVGTIKYQTVGSVPNRTFVVEFDDVGHYGNNNKKVSFQIVLLEN